MERNRFAILYLATRINNALFSERNVRNALKNARYWELCFLLVLYNGRVPLCSVTDYNEFFKTLLSTLEDHVLRELSILSDSASQQDLQGVP